MCCSPAGYELNQLISALRKKEGQRSSLGHPPVGEQEQPMGNPSSMPGVVAEQAWGQAWSHSS